MPNEKRKPHYSLSRIQELLWNPSTRRVTATSRVGAAKFNWGEQDIVQCILDLTHQDFYKSMTSKHNTKLWQDVYRPTFRTVDVYVKLQIALDGRGVVILFKERQPGESP